MPVPLAGGRTPTLKGRRITRSRPGVAHRSGEGLLFEGRGVGSLRRRRGRCDGGRAGDDEGRLDPVELGPVGQEVDADLSAVAAEVQDRLARPEQGPDDGGDVGGAARADGEGVLVELPGPVVEEGRLFGLAGDGVPWHEAVAVLLRSASVDGERGRRVDGAVRVDVEDEAPGDVHARPGREEGREADEDAAVAAWRRAASDGVVEVPGFAGGLRPGGGARGVGEARDEGPGAVPQEAVRNDAAEALRGVVHAAGPRVPVVDEEDVPVGELARGVGRVEAPGLREGCTVQSPARAGAVAPQRPDDVQISARDLRRKRVRHSQRWRLISRSFSARCGSFLDERASLGTNSKRGCFSLGRCFEHTHVEAT